MLQSEIEKNENHSQHYDKTLDNYPTDYNSDFIIDTNREIVEYITEKIKTIDKKLESIERIDNEIYDINKKIIILCSKTDILDKEFDEVNNTQKIKYEDRDSKSVFKFLKSDVESISNKVSSLLDSNSQIESKISSLSNSLESTDDKVKNLVSKTNNVDDNFIPYVRTEIDNIKKKFETFKKSNDDNYSSTQQEIQSLLNKHQNVERNNNENFNNINNHHSDLIDKFQTLSQKINQIADNKPLQEISKMIDHLKNDFNDHKENTSQNSHSIDLLGDNLNAFKDEINENNSSIEDKLKELHESLSSLKDHLSKISSLITTTNDSFLQRIKKLSDSDSEHTRKINSLISGDDLSLELSKALEDKISSLTDNNNSLLSMIEKLQSNDINTSRDITNLTKKISSVIETNNSKFSEIDSNISLNSGLGDKISSLKESFESFIGLYNNYSSNVSNKLLSIMELIKINDEKSNDKHTSINENLRSYQDNTNLQINSIRDSISFLADASSTAQKIYNSISSINSRVGSTESKFEKLDGEFLKLKTILESFKSSNEDQINKQKDQESQLEKIQNDNSINSGFLISLQNTIKEMKDASNSDTRFSTLLSQFNVLSNLVSTLKTTLESNSGSNNTIKLQTSFSILSSKVDSISNEIDRKTLPLTEIQKEIAYIKQIVTTVTDQNGFKLLIQKVSDNVDKANDSTLKLKQTTDKHETIINDLKSKIDALKEENNSTAQVSSNPEIKTLETEIKSSVDAFKESTSNQISNLDAEMIKFRAQISSYLTPSQVSLIKEELQETKNIIQQVVNEDISDLKKGLINLKSRIELLYSNFENQNNLAADTESTPSSNENKITVLQNEVEELKSIIGSLNISNIQNLILKLQNQVEYNSNDHSNKNGIKLVPGYDSISGKTNPSVTSLFDDSDESLLAVGNEVTFRKDIKGFSGLDFKSGKFGYGPKYSIKEKYSLDVKGDSKLDGKLNGIEISDLGRVPRSTQNVFATTGSVIQIPYSGSFPNGIRVLLDNTEIKQSKKNGYLYSLGNEMINIRCGSESIGHTFDRTGKLKANSSGNYSVQIF